MQQGLSPFQNVFLPTIINSNRCHGHILKQIVYCDGLKLKTQLISKLFLTFVSIIA